MAGTISMAGGTASDVDSGKKKTHFVRIEAGWILADGCASPCIHNLQPDVLLHTFGTTIT